MGERVLRLFNISPELGKDFCVPCSMPSSFPTACTIYSTHLLERRGGSKLFVCLANNEEFSAARMAFPAPATAPSFPQAPLLQARPPSGLQSQSHAGLRLPSNKKTIYDRNLNRSRNAELSRSSFAYLFMEMVSYAQKRVTGIQDLEKR